MRRRTLLGAVGTAFTGAVAGCTDYSEEADDPDQVASKVTVTVRNNDTRTRSIAFLLRTTRGQVTYANGFVTGEIQPGDRWTRELQNLEPGDYELEVHLPELDMDTVQTWTGLECPIKEIGVDLEVDGFQIRSECPDNVTTTTTQ
jgi:hypothetical protein